MRNVPFPPVFRGGISVRATSGDSLFLHYFFFAANILTKSISTLLNPISPQRSSKYSIGSTRTLNYHCRAVGEIPRGYWGSCVSAQFIFWILDHFKLMKFNVAIKCVAASTRIFRWKFVTDIGKGSIRHDRFVSLLALFIKNPFFYGALQLHSWQRNSTKTD